MRVPHDAWKLRIGEIITQEQSVQCPQVTPRMLQRASLLFLLCAVNVPRAAAFVALAVAMSNAGGASCASRAARSANRSAAIADNAPCAPGVGAKLSR